MCLGRSFERALAAGGDFGDVFPVDREIGRIRTMPNRP
jgi:hypothetical protein